MAADPQLLSFLEKVSNPITTLNVSLRLLGVYALPEQWKVTDEANPNLFTYEVDLMHWKFQGGKIDPRKVDNKLPQLTERQLREQEEQKSKKAGKKESKEEEKPREEQSEVQKKKRIEWEALSEEEKFYRTSEDPFKSFYLKFVQKAKEETLTEQKLSSFEAAINENKLLIQLTRRPDVSQEQITKLKKAKPKTLNLGQLYAAKYKGFLDLKPFKKAGTTVLQQRIHVQFNDEMPGDCIKIDAGRCYVGFEIILSEAITPLVTEIKPAIQTLLPNFPKSYNKSSRNLVAKLCSDIRKGIIAISKQYSSLFAKEKDHQDDRKYPSSSINTNLNINAVSTLRINEINKRKQVFLNEFVSSGKFGILLDKISVYIRAIVVDKFRKEKQAGPIPREAVQRTLSQLNLYFTSCIQSTIDECMAKDINAIHQDLVLAHQTTRSSRKQLIAPIVEESNEQRQSRLAAEYDIVEDVTRAQEKYINLIILNSQSVHTLENYTKFCIKHKKMDQAYLLVKRIVSKTNDFKFKIMQALFMIQRKRHEAIELLNVINDHVAPSQLDEKVIVNQLLSFAYELTGDQRRAEKYLAAAEKCFQTKLHPNIRLDQPSNPYADPVPKIPKSNKYVSPLSSQQSQQIRSSLIDLLAEYGFYELVASYLDKINDSDKKNRLRVQILLYETKYDEALQIVDEMIEKDNKNMELLLIKSEICYRSEKLFECEQVFLFLLKLKPNSVQCYSIYLRLGLTYLHRKSWEDARNSFMKACELRSNSSVAWHGLGVSNFELENYKESQQAFNLCNVYNPLSKQTEQHLVRISEISIKQHQKQYKYLADQNKMTIY